MRYIALLSVLALSACQKPAPPTQPTVTQLVAQCEIDADHTYNISSDSQDLDIANYVDKCMITHRYKYVETSSVCAVNVGDLTGVTSMAQIRGKIDSDAADVKNSYTNATCYKPDLQLSK